MPDQEDVIRPTTDTNTYKDQEVAVTMRLWQGSAN